MPSLPLRLLRRRVSSLTALAGATLLGFALLPSTSWAAAAEADSSPVFSGVLTSQKRTHLLLTHGVQSRWTEVGQHFGSYRVESYDPKSDTVALKTAAGETVRLPLKDAKVQAGAVAAPDSSSSGNRALWEKIKELDGAELIQALHAADERSNGGDRARAAFTYLFGQHARLAKEAAQAKLATEQAAAISNPTDDDRVRLRSAQRIYEGTLANVSDIHGRLEQIALQRKKELRDSVAP